jgi:plasmid stabilization system protein ParE
MRSWRLTPEAERGLAQQIDYLIGAGAPRAAEMLLQRVENFLATTLLAWPRTGHFIPEREIWESWIPRTRIVVWYTFDASELVVIAVWHTSQDRC